MNNQVQVGAGGNMTVRNLWLDDCLQADSVPYVCLANAQGRLSVQRPEGLG